MPRPLQQSVITAITRLPAVAVSDQPWLCFYFSLFFDLLLLQSESKLSERPSSDSTPIPPICYHGSRLMTEGDCDASPRDLCRVDTSVAHRGMRRVSPDRHPYQLNSCWIEGKRSSQPTTTGIWIRKEEDDDSWKTMWPLLPVLYGRNQRIESWTLAYSAYPSGTNSCSPSVFPSHARCRGLWFRVKDGDIFFSRLFRYIWVRLFFCVWIQNWKVWSVWLWGRKDVFWNTSYELTLCQITMSTLDHCLRCKR